jgi:ketosteroid isomerase-like protein
MERRDLDAVLETFAPDAVLRSPFTNRVAFEGREQIAAILAVILNVFEDLTYTDEIELGQSGVLVGHARVGGREIDWVDHVRLASDGRIAEFTAYFRPLPASAVGLRVIGAGLGRRRSAVLAAVISTLARPLGVMAAIADRVGAWLVRRSLAP